MNTAPHASDGRAPVARRPRVALLIALLSLLPLPACGEEKGPATPSGAAGPTGEARSGGEAAPPAPSDARPALSVEKTEVLASAGASLDAALMARSPLIDATVRVKPGAGSVRARFEATLRYRVPLDTLDGAARLTFQVAANIGAASGQAGRQPVTLDRLELHGGPGTAEGTASRWEVPVLGREGVADLTFQLSGELPAFDDRRQRHALEQELDALPALAQLLPDIPQLDAAEVFGASDQLLVLAGALPSLAGTPPAVFRLEVQVEPTASAWTVLATGREAPPSGTARRFVGLSHELAVVLAGGFTLTREAVSGRELTLAHRAGDGSGVGGDPAKAPAELMRLARRSLESLEDRLGPLDGSTLTLLVSEELDELGAAALPGLVLLPRRHGPLAPPRPPPSPSPSSNDWLARLDLLLAHHPGPREAYERAIATAIARLPWSGWDHGPLGRLLEHGLAADSALRAIRASMGEKAQRRALELGWRLPYQLGRMRGAADPALITFEPGGDPASAKVARAKSGLAFEALARALGDPPWTALTLELLAARRRGTPLSDDLLREHLARHAARPELAQGLWTRWLHERRGDTDVGELRPEVLLEYLVTDGAVTGLSHALLDNAGELAGSPLGQKALARLSAGQPLDTGFAIAMLGELLGPSLDPTSRRWLELGTGLFSQESRKNALEGLIDELGGELGIPEADRARLGLLGGLVLDALDAPAPDPGPDTGDAPEASDGPTPPPDEPAPAE